MSSRSEASSHPTDAASSSGGGAAAGTTGLHPSGRKIQVKFAPLPDPRKLEEDESLSITSDSEEAAYDESRLKSGTIPVSPLLGGKATLYDGDVAVERSPRWSTKRLLRPLMPKSSAASNANDSSGGSPLFRPSSMDSIRSTQSAAGAYQSSGQPPSAARSALSSLGLGSMQRSASDLEHQRNLLRTRTSSGASSTTILTGGASALLAKMSPLKHKVT